MLLTLIIHILAYTTSNNIVPVEQHRVSVVCKYTLLTHTQKPWLMHTTATQTQTNTQQHWSHITTRTPTRSRHTETHAHAVTHGDWERGEGCPCEGWVTSVLWSALAGTWMGFYSCMQYIRGKGLGLQKLHLPWCTSASHQRSHKHTACVGRFYLSQPVWGVDVVDCLLYHISALFEIIIPISGWIWTQSKISVLTMGLRSGCVRIYPLLVMANAYPCIPSWRK